ncbi:MAG: aldo/keto reductase [Candidatus Hydrogenedentes bacterium]|nr:aldo/keto reductase [Candidatus Hydrogenedentota bacterium]
MKYGNIPGVTKPVSRLVQGTLMGGSAELEKTFAMYDGFFETGCNTFDTGHVYGNGDNERTVGRWVRERGIRNKVVIIGKGAHHNADRRRVTPFDITADIYDSLARFKFDYMDLYLLHRDDPNVPVGPIVEVLNEHHKAGRIHAFGGSNWTASRIAEANAYANARGLTPFVASSPNYSLAEQIQEPWENCVSVGGPKHRDQLEWYRKELIAVCCWSSLAAGFFSGRFNRTNVAENKDTLFMRCYYSEDNMRRLHRVEILAKEMGFSVPQIALAYVVNQPMNLFPLVGCPNKEELQKNIAALDIKLTEKELAWLDLRSEER